MTTLLISISDILVASISNQSDYSSSLIEIAKILAISCGWVGGLILWMRSKEKNKSQVQQVVSSSN